MSVGIIFKLDRFVPFGFVFFLLKSQSLRFRPAVWNGPSSRALSPITAVNRLRSIAATPVFHPLSVLTYPKQRAVRAAHERVSTIVFFTTCSCVVRRAERARQRRCARHWLLRRHTGDLLLQQRLSALLQRADDHSLPARRHLEQPQQDTQMQRWETEEEKEGGGVI